MKRLAIALLWLCITTSFFFSCQNKKIETEASAAAEDEWAEMDSFHTIMAEVYHPLKDSGDVRPIMARATELADEAEKWAAAPLPSKVDNEEVKKLLAKLKTDTRQLADQIIEGTEEDVAGAQLTALHELFHQIQEKWYLKTTN